MLRARFCTAPAAKQASGCCAATSQNLPKPLSARLHAQHAPRSFVQPSASHDEAHPTPVASTRPQGWSNTVTAGTVHAPAKQAATNGNSTQPAASRLRVAVDVDEVLGAFVATLNRFCMENYSMDYNVKDYWVYEFAKIWNCSQEQSNHIVHEFFKSQHFNDGIPVIPGAHEALTRLSSNCDLVVVTSRQHVIQDVTLEWIDRHYAGLFQEVYFGNHFALAGTSRKKSDICRSIGASVLVDDNPTYAMECAEAGINVLLYDWEHSYPWSKIPEQKMHPLIKVVRDWKEVEETLSALALRNAQATNWTR